jgi:hypothetical protein
LFELADYCRAGKLKEVGEWIAAGKPLDPPRNAKRSRRQSPLEIAIEKGFFALAELLLDGGCDPLANGNALRDAVRCKEPEIAKLLLDRGVPAQSVHISDIFDAGRPMLEMFLARGLDPTADNAYFEALCSKVHPLLFVLKEFGDRYPDLQRQADMALCHYVEKGNARNIGLLLWAGAKPDAEARDPNIIDGESTSCALCVAAREGRVDILKQLKPEKYPDVLRTIFAEIWRTPSAALIDYLTGLGAPINTKQNGGCAVIEHLLWRVELRSRNDFYSNPNEVKESLAAIEHLCRLGAKWVPDGDESQRNRRDRFRKIEARNLLELFRIFRAHDAAPVELLDSIIGSPAIRKSLGSHLRAIEELLHPSPPKTTADTVAAAGTTRVKEKAAPPSIAEIRAAAQELLLDVVRQEPRLHFTIDFACSGYDTKPLKRRLGMPKDDDRDIEALLAEAADKLNQKVKCFQTKTDWSGRSHCRLFATLNEGAEWPEALKEAWSFAEAENESLLTDEALRIRELIRSEELGSDWIPEKSITYKVGLYGRERVLTPYLHEISNKTEFEFKWECEGERWGPFRYRFSRREAEATRPEIPPGLNPRLDVHIDDFGKTDQEVVQQLLYRELLEVTPTGKEPFFLFSIATRRDYARCFGKPITGEQLANFFATLPLNDALTRFFDFTPQKKCWYAGVQPKDNWDRTLAAIREEMSQPTLEEPPRRD